MSETKTITLAGRDFEVPRLPIRINMTAYPLCRKLSATFTPERLVAAKGALDCSEEEMANLIDLAYCAVRAADPTFTREEFDELPITPPELLDAFFPMRYQTGGWVAVSPKEGQDAPGEARGAKKPRK